MTVRHSSWAERVYGPSLKKSCCKACTKNVFEETPCDTEVGGSIYAYIYVYIHILWLKHTSCTRKGATFMAVALHLMVQKTIFVWLVNGCCHISVNTWDPLTSSCFVVLDRCCCRAPRAQETLAKHVCVACRCQRPQPW